MAVQHSEPGIVEPEQVLLRWPLAPVPSRHIADEAHKQAVEFKKQSGASPEQIDTLMRRHNDGLDLDQYFQRKLQSRVLD